MDTYEKKYNEALERAQKELAACGSMDCDAARQIFRLFPQLRESEDEKIRKEIIDFLETIPASELKRIPRPISEWFSWLEKQKEHHYIKRNPLFDKCVAECDPAIMKEVSDKVDEMLRKEQKPAEWSEEDKSILEALIYDIERLPMQGVLTHRPCDSYIKFLKALRPGWKPTEEQMEALRNAFHKLANTDVADSVRLSIMYDNLKNL